MALVLLLVQLCCAQTSAGTSTNALPDSALSTRLTPTMPSAYYVKQGVKYFRTMQTGVPIKIRPHYSANVIRWEWHPWLLLTGYKRINLINSDILLKLYSTKYDTIECRSFAQNPFCRCHVMFNYSGKRVPIYEEFTFNDNGEITFIEAWSDYPSLLPMKSEDYWAEGPGVKRLSTRVPGLGNADGRIHLYARWMLNAAQKDADLANLLHRLHHPITSYIKELSKQKNEIAKAFYPPKGDVYPYK